MKPSYRVILPLVFLLFSAACDKEEIPPAMESFCSVIPGGWECKINTDEMDPGEYPQDAGVPLAIISYKNPEREFTRYDDTKDHPSLILDLYPVEQKQELQAFIDSQQQYSSCIPLYYGETADYFILTSPCFINHGAFTEEADSCIRDLHTALKSIMSSYNTDLTGN